MKGRFWQRSRLKRGVLVSAFLFKVLAGCLYGVFYFNVYHTGDIVHYFQDSRVIYSALPENPGHFLQLTFGYSPSGEVPEHLSYLYDQMWLSWRTQEYFSVRVNSVFNLLSFGHFYGNIALLCIVSMMGLVWLHEALSEAFPQHSGSLVIAVFFMPSTLFWCSAIHKDAVTLFSLGALLYSILMLIRQPQLRHVLLVAAGTFFLWNSRSYMVMILLPNLFVYTYGLRHEGPHFLRFFAMNAGLLLAVIALEYFVPQIDLLGKLAFEQEFLLALKGNTHLPMRPIGDTLGSLLSNIPMALDHVWLKTFTNPPVNGFQILAAISGASQVAFILWLGFGWRFRHYNTPMLAFCIFFSFAVLLVVGLTVPALGAIVRYKSSMLPLVFAAAIAGNNPERLKARFLGWALDPSRLLKPANSHAADAVS